MDMNLGVQKEYECVKENESEKGVVSEEERLIEPIEVREA